MIFIELTPALKKAIEDNSPSSFVNGIRDIAIKGVEYDGFTYRGKFPITYSDQELTVVQFYKPAARSYNTVIELLKTYFPQFSTKDLLQELLKVEIRMIRCPDIDKYVFDFFCPDSGNFNNFIESYLYYFPSSYLTFPKPDYVDSTGISFNDIIKESGYAEEIVEKAEEYISVNTATS